MSSETENRKKRIEGMRAFIKASNPIVRRNQDLVSDRMEKGFKIGENEAASGSAGLHHKLADISLFDQKYEMGQKIGEGTDGVVSKCINRQTGKLYAVKAMTMDDEQIYFLKRNYKSVKNLKHEGVIKYKALYLDLCKHKSYLVMEYIPYPNLLREIAIGDQKSLRRVFYQIFEVLQHLHQKNICHRDIKPENVICVSDTNQIKLVDFGISKDMLSRGEKMEMLTLTGTPYYRAPQMFLGGGYDERVDLWAAGVSIYKMLTGATPFESPYISDTIDKILKGEFDMEPLKKFSPEVQDLVKKLLMRKEQRISIYEALNHPWFDDQEIGIPLTLERSPSSKAKSDYKDEGESSPFLYFLNERMEMPSFQPLEGSFSLLLTPVRKYSSFNKKIKLDDLTSDESLQ